MNLRYKKLFIGIACLSLGYLITSRAFDLKSWWEEKIAKPTEEKVFKPAREEVFQPIGNWIDKAAADTGKFLGDVFDFDTKKYTDHPHKNDVASVRVGNDLSSEENQFIQKRLAVVKKSLERSFPEMNFPDSSIPRIAFCFTGGGYRAMIASLGFLEGAQNTGILDKALYMAGLSGSTWSTVPWLMSGITSLRDYQRQLIPQVAQLFLVPLSPAEGLDVNKRRSVKDHYYKQPMSIIDDWGALLAARLLGWSSDKQAIFFSDGAEKLNDGSWPLPIATAVSSGGKVRADRIAAGSPYVWFEFTPYEVGAEYLHAWVPTWAFGRKFENGKSVDFAAEQTLGYLLGIFGSAFSADMATAGLTGLISPESRKQMGEETYDELSHLSVVQGGIVNNFTRGIGTTPEMARNLSVFNMIDGHYGGGTPYLPLVRPERAIDIIIFFDLSDSDFVGKMLDNLFANVKQFSKRELSPLPDTIDYADVASRPMTIFGKVNDLSKHMLLYVPQIKNTQLPNYGFFDPQFTMKKGFSGTANFVYAPDQFKTLSGYAREDFESIAPAILEVIKERALAKGATEKKS